MPDRLTPSFNPFTCQIRLADVRAPPSPKLGFGPIAWLLISEVFPLEVRGQAVAFAVQNNFAWNLVVSLLYPVLIDEFGTAFGNDYKYCAGFAIFAVLTLYGE